MGRSTTYKTLTDLFGTKLSPQRAGYKNMGAEDELTVGSLQDYIPILERDIKETQELIELIKEYGADCVVPLHVFLKEVDTKERRLRKSPFERFYDMVHYGFSNIMLTLGHNRTINRVRTVRLTKKGVNIINKDRCWSKDDERRYKSLAKADNMVLQNKEKIR